MNRSLFWILAVAFLFPGGETVATGAVPECRVDPAFADSSIGNAGCFVVEAGRVLLVRHGATGKLTFPAGFAERGESAQCTAHRETWEETGIQVRVGRLIKVFTNDFHLYLCEPLDREALKKAALEVPAAAIDEVREVVWTDPVSLSADDWRFPQYFGEVKLLLATYTR